LSIATVWRRCHPWCIPPEAVLDLKGAGAKHVENDHRRQAPIMLIASLGTAAPPARQAWARQ
jgi:hypothetical protein